MSLWTDERKIVARSMIENGKSCSEVAKTLGDGLTRNAVIGKAHREGWTVAPNDGSAARQQQRITARASAPPRKAPSAKPAPVVQAAKPKVERSAAPLDLESTPLPEAAPLAAAGAPIRVVDFQPGRCKFPVGAAPIGSGEDMPFCGGGTKPGQIYCPEHYARAYTPRAARASRVAHMDRYGR